MPRWLKKVGKLANKASDSIVDRVKEKVEENLEGVDLGPAVQKLQAVGSKCQVTARETVEICDSANEKRQQMIDFATEIQSTLSSLQDQEQDASILETIKELTDGDKVKAAMELAQGLDVAALSCVDKSIEMIDTMEDGMDSLPEMMQKAIEKAAESSEQDDDEEEDEDLLKTLDRDIEDVKTCIVSIQKLNLVTGLKVGLQAFTNLADKAKRSRSMFDSIRGFACDVEEITQAFTNMDVMSVASKSKDLLRCIHMTDVMRQLAEGAGKLIKVIIDLFKATADRISALWAALAFAKDCMSDCVIHVTEARSLCVDARDKSTSLIDKSRSVKDQLETVGEVNMKSIGAVRELSEGGEIREAIELARNMDGFVLECTAKVVSMVDRVTEGFRNIPEILTEGIDISTAGKDAEDPAPPDVQEDITELETSRRAIEEADVVSAAKAGVKGFSGVSGKAVICKDMLQLVEGFAGKCESTIGSFMSVWDLESATTKITEMCRIVNLGEIMKQFAEQIKRLIAAMIALMTSAIEKFSKLDLGEVAGDVGEAVKGAVENVTGQVKDKLKFWKK